MNKLRGLLPILLLVARTALAQYDTLTLAFHALTIENGLSQGMVNSIVQDRYGFLWFGTKDGLNMYDGYHFEVFRHDPEDSTSLSDSNVRMLFEDRQGRLWVGTEKGIDLFSRSTSSFIHVLPETIPSGGLTQRMVQDVSGDLWVSRLKGLTKLTFTGAAQSADDPLPKFRTDHFLDKATWVSTDRSGMVWVGEVDGGGYRIVPKHDGTDQIDSVKLGHPVGNERRGRGLHDLTGLTVVEDTVRNKLYGVHKFGIVELDDASTRVQSLVEYAAPSFGDMRCMLPSVDARGRIWICAYTGIYVFDPATTRMHRVLPMDPNLTVRAGVVQCTYRDRTGLLWIGTSGYGLLTHNERTRRFNTVLGPSCSVMQPTRKGHVLIGQKAMFLAEFDPVAGAWARAIPFAQIVKHPAFRAFSTSPVATTQDSDGLYWFNYAGLMSYSARDGATKQYPRDAAAMATFPEEDFCWPIRTEGDTAIWFGSAHTFGRFDRRTQRYSHFQIPIPTSAAGDQFLQVIHRARDGDFWLGSLSGLFHFDPRTTAWKRFTSDPKDPQSLAADIIYSIEADPTDPANILWVGTKGGGLNKLDKRTGKVQRYTTKQGLPNDVVYGILSDDTGRLWMSTNKGLACFTPATGTFRNYAASDGLQSDEFNRYAYCKLADGTLFFGGVEGFNYFKPGQLNDDTVSAPIRITGIKLINRPVDYRDPGSPLKAPAYLSAGMTIPYDANMITFEFATMEFAAPEGHHYQYKLDGFDPDWIMVGSERSAVYTNLDPGTYTFRVLGDNRDGVWDKQGTSFQLVVLPPWWRTWWAYMLYALTVGGGLLLYIRIRTSGLKRQKELLERTVVERTTELSRKKDEADAQRKRAEQSEQVKRQFLANMSHEIRTPLNAIVGMSSALRNDAPQDQATRQSYVEAIATSSGDLLNIVNDILDLSRIEAGRLEPEKVRMDPRAEVNRVVAVMRYRAVEKGLVLEAHVAPDVPVTLIGDPTRLNQVLMNLLGNAIKFTERGSIHIAMDVTQTLQAAHVASTQVLRRSVAKADRVDPLSAVEEKLGIHCTISDTGIGIAPDRLVRVFDEFTQAETDHTRRFGGSGLGLTICKRLVEMQGGTIIAESELGKGSTFSFTIPYGIAEAAKEDLCGPETSGPHGLHDLRILLAEDYKLNIMVAEMELKKAIPGSRLEVAANGQIALDMVQANDYDLILMDVQMPVMDGYEATRRIRALGTEKARTPILAMTANVMEAEVQQCMDAGMDGFIPKPFDQEQLVEAIRKAMAPPDAR